MKKTIKILTLTFLTGNLYAMEQSLSDDKQTEEVKSPQLDAAKEILSLRDLVMQTLAQFYSKPYNDGNKFTLKTIALSGSAPVELIGLLIEAYLRAWPFLSDEHKKEVIRYFISCDDKALLFTDKVLAMLKFCMNPDMSKKDKGSFLRFCDSYIKFLEKQYEQLKDKENKTPQEKASIKMYEIHKDHTLPLLEFFFKVLNHTSSHSWGETGDETVFARAQTKNIEQFTVIREPIEVKGTLPPIISDYDFKLSIFDSLVFKEPYKLATYFELLGDAFYTALHQEALAIGNASQLEFLAKRGKLANLDEQLLVDSIHKAFTQWDGDGIVRSLLSNECSPLVKDNDGHTFLYKAIAESSIKIARVFIEFLLKQYSSCLALPENLKDLEVFIALIKGDNEAIGKLITKETINTPLVGTQHVTPLWIAVLSNNSALVTYLLNEGADIAIRGEDEETLLHQAAKQGYAEIVRILLSKNAIDINAQEVALGRTALLLAVEENYLECVRILLEHEADPTITDMNGYTLLESANENNKEMIELLKTAVQAEDALEHEDE